MPNYPPTHDSERQTTGTEDERVTYRESAAVLEAIDALVEAGVYPNRSEAVREATRQLVREREVSTRD